MFVSVFFTTFALVIELERHIEILLLSNDCVIVPGFGGFMAHQVDARYDGTDNMFLPPLRTIGFNPQLKLNDSLLAQSYTEAYDISYPEALNRLEEEVAEIRQRLESTGKFELNNIGTIFLNENGNYTFEPCEAGILTPSLYGLGGFNMLPLSSLQNNASESTEAARENQRTAIEVELKAEKNNAEKNCEKAEVSKLALTPSVFDEEEDDEESAEFIQIKKSVLRNAIAACIAIILFFTISTPLSKPNVQMGKVDTSMLTRLMPKEMTNNGNNPEKLVLSKSKEASNESASNDAESLSIQESTKNAKPYYGIVLASRVTKRNAATYVEQLQKQGVKGAKVVISATNVKVVYGNYETESQAYKSLHELRDQEPFADGWITKVDE